MHACWLLICAVIVDVRLNDAEKLWNNEKITDGREERVKTSTRVEKQGVVRPLNENSDNRKSDQTKMLVMCLKKTGKMDGDLILTLILR